MVCEHLASLERELASSGALETFRGQPWSDNCREWVYFDIVLDVDSIKERSNFAPFVIVHENTDQRSGTERGLVCGVCKDGIMGRLSGTKVFK
jgi:hypothetical protein